MTNTPVNIRNITFILHRNNNRVAPGQYLSCCFSCPRYISLFLPACLQINMSECIKLHHHPWRGFPLKVTWFFWAWLDILALSLFFCCTANTPTTFTSLWKKGSTFFHASSLLKWSLCYVQQATFLQDYFHFITPRRLVRPDPFPSIINIIIFLYGRLTTSFILSSLSSYFLCVFNTVLIERHKGNNLFWANKSYKVFPCHFIS